MAKEVSPAHAARRLGVTLDAIYKLIYAGKLPAHKSGTRWLIPVVRLKLVSGLRRGVMQPLAVDVREAARLTSLSTSTIRRHIRVGQLKAIRLGRRVVVSLESLEKLVREGPSPLNSVNGQTSRAISSYRQDTFSRGSDSAGSAGPAR